jgi:hypothetical protein
LNGCLKFVEKIEEYRKDKGLDKATDTNEAIIIEE